MCTIVSGYCLRRPFNDRRVGTNAADRSLAFPSSHVAGATILVSTNSTRNGGWILVGTWRLLVLGITSCSVGDKGQLGWANNDVWRVGTDTACGRVTLPLSLNTSATVLVAANCSRESALIIEATAMAFRLTSLMLCTSPYWRFLGANLDNRHSDRNA